MAVRNATPSELNISNPLARKGGVYIAEVFRKSPAYRSGLRSGDIVVRQNGKTATDAGQFRENIKRIGWNKKIYITYIRRGKPNTVLVHLGEMWDYSFSIDGYTSANSADYQLRVGGFGVGVQSGAYILTVPDREEQLKTGDIVLRVGSVAIDRPRDMEREVKSYLASGSRMIQIVVVRDDVIRYIKWSIT
ncbi:MAG: PDZ domain-containing protein [Candidatus Thiodiazotropha sp. (ex Troendleina suluensis)]|nr:PDZ domain-containing protein [Candidatus Thiodiazotropha sp. (ex Troendleina suluensis)]